jgi:hypothetical protein
MVLSYFTLLLLLLLLVLLLDRDLQRSLPTGSSENKKANALINTVGAKTGTHTVVLL